VLFAIRSNEKPLVELANVQSHFAPCSFTLSPTAFGGWEIDGESIIKGGWELYMKAVVAECLSVYFKEDKQPRGFQCVVSGNVPPGSGLSVGGYMTSRSESGIFNPAHLAADGYYRAFNLGRGKGLSVLDMIKAMERATGHRYTYEIVGRR